MSSVISGVMAKLQAYLPRQIGDNRRWSTAYVEKLITAADNSVRERCELSSIVQEIQLVSGQAEYALDSRFISINRVEFSYDGSTYIDYLTATTLGDLDDFHYWWRKDEGTRPEYYTLLTTPGCPEVTAVGSGSKGDPARIMIYRPVGDVSDETIKVTGIGLPYEGSEIATEAVQSLCHVPYCMAIMLLVEEPAMAGQHYMSFLEGCDKVLANSRTIQAEGI